MEKLWAGRASEELNQLADDFNASISVDFKMFRQDIQGSVAHTKMLQKQGILPQEDGETILHGLAAILSDLESGALAIDPQAEDIHSFVEAELTRRVGDAGKRLHTARSRNDQVAVDLRMVLRDETEQTKALLKALISVLADKAEEHAQTVMPGYTHLQRAQPVTFGHHLLAYGMMFDRDLGRLRDAAKRMNRSPLGCCALAGTTYPTDRGYEAALLGFDGVTENSIDGVSDRDFCVELCGALSILMMHLSRFSEELILWSSWEFRFIQLSDAYTTGSSIMPQKKNPDMAELVRGKTGRVYGNLMGILTVLKGLPLAYNKDLQEDKEAVFDSFATACRCLEVFTPMIQTMSVRAENMKNAASGGFINATDLADYLTKRGLPFRSAYKITGALVAYCMEIGETLESLPLSEYQKFSTLFSEDLFDFIRLDACVKSRTSEGGPGEASIAKQIAYLRGVLSDEGFH